MPKQRKIIKSIGSFFTSGMVLVALVLIAIVLGVAIYEKDNKGTSYPSNNTNTQVASSNPPVQNTPVNNSLTETQKSLFYGPGKNATPEQQKTFSSLVAANATPGDTVTVKDCTASPVVLKLQYGSTFTVKNT